MPFAFLENAIFLEGRGRREAALVTKLGFFSVARTKKAKTEGACGTDCFFPLFSMHMFRVVRSMILLCVAAVLPLSFTSELY